jgi:hypothetical protein
MSITHTHMHDTTRHDTRLKRDLILDCTFVRADNIYHQLLILCFAVSPRRNIDLAARTHRNLTQHCTRNDNTCSLLAET